MVPRSRGPWLVTLVVVVLVGALLAIALLPRPKQSAGDVDPIHQIEPVPVADLVKFAGSDACASCHPDYSKTHAQSEHARAMSRVEVGNHGQFFSWPGEVVDPVRKSSYKTAVQNGRCVLIASTADGQKTAEATYGFGSGKHGITYLGKQGNLEPELRLSYFPDFKKWAFSPGQQQNSKGGGLIIETGLVKPAETIEGCFLCHSTVIAKENDRLLPDTMMMGVGCESCHGPAQAHIAAAKRGDQNLQMNSLRGMDGRVISQRVCGQCHRSPVNEDPFDDFNVAQRPRLQGLALSLSPCFTNSNGKLSCLTCHDAHDQSPKPSTFYNKKCVECHSGAAASQRECSIDPSGDCVPCHMPKQAVGMPVDLRYNTHWIKVWAGR